MNENYLTHYGVLGMHWGIRNYQNKDGSLTAAGRKRYSNKEEKDVAKARTEYRNANRQYNKDFNNAYYKAHQAYSLSKKKRDANRERWEQVAESARNADAKKKDYKVAKQKLKTRRQLDEAAEKYAKQQKVTNAIINLTGSERAKAISKYLDEGYKQYTKALKDNGDVRVKAIKDKSYKKTSDYKHARSEYFDQYYNKGQALAIESNALMLKVNELTKDRNY